ncbi:MAG: CDGSH iron-sulfur domain-containing protein [Gammaproteobacteria bacterium]|nr:CDGSH iron-sulfur domain-containing protein [Gammaproteobacteria bacterium]
MSNNNSAKPVYSGNSIMVRPDGPLICKSDSAITLQNADEELIMKDKEFALCRCGLSNKKPFCDGTHKTQGVQATQAFSDDREEDINGVVADLTITVKTHSMYSIQGPVTIFSRDGLSKTTRTKSALCRCGHSANKPFCDGAHNRHDFTE